MEDNDMERTYDRVLMKIKLIGLYQIIGGIIGFGMFGWILSITETVNFSIVLLYAFIAMLFCYSIFCGVMLFRNPKWGLRATFINQVIQIFQISLLGYAYKYISGLGFMLGVDLTDTFTFLFNFEISGFLLHVDSGDGTLFIKFNLLAIFLSYYSMVLLERYEAIVKEREVVNIEDIGQ